MTPCEVRWNCNTPTHCPFCVDGSEYSPKNKKVPFPSQARRERERKDARRQHKRSASYKSGRSNQRKGKRREREVAKLFGGARVPLSGIMDGHPNDVLLDNGWRVEVKARGSGLGVLYGWLEDADVIAFREPGGTWLFAMSGSSFKSWNGLGLTTRRSAKTLLRKLDRPSFEVRLPGGALLIPRERRGGFSTIRGWLKAEKADALFFKADRKDWLVILDGDHFVELLTKNKSEWPERQFA